ncbi:hypothetical protein IMZ48_46060, partial [Candidatus Bathyarchaeota archaeon]|nr:hypothetical protein [Candidatus Bathyarchaeota archaeon]
MCRRVISDHEREDNGISNFAESSVQLKCFGSLSSGFATKASDMDLGLLSPTSLVQPDVSDSPVPRLLEKALLDAGLGARLLTRTRVPIIKLCEIPPAQLLHDLRKEREKWDSGVGLEDAGTTEEGLPKDTQLQSAPGVEQESTRNTPGAEAISALQGDTDPSELGNGQPQLKSDNGDGLAQPAQVSLYQAETQSLSAYYGLAKRVLRKMGGHDLTASNYRNFTEQDFELLEAVARAFLDGLCDRTLRERLDASPAFQVRSMAGPQNRRSLLGIYTQVEGEAILLRWEGRALRERADEHERAVAATFESWKTLRNKAVSGFDWIHHSKELQVSLEILKRFPSVQLVLLEQGQFEPATLYSDRAAGLLSKLIPLHSNSGRGSEPEVLERYISGVYHHDIRSSLGDLSRELGEDASFRVSVRKHKALQLAHELEKGLAAGLYPDTARETVERYAELLRGPMRRVASGSGHEEWAIPVAAASRPVL